MQKIVNDPVIGPAIRTLNEITGLNDPIRNPSNHRSNATMANIDIGNENSLSKISEEFTSNEQIKPGILGEVKDPEFRFSCECTIEEIEINAPEKLMDYLLYC